MSILLLLFFRFLIIASVVVLFLGLFKPEWLRFRGKQPDLLMTFVMAVGMFMMGFTGASKTYYAVDEEVSEQAESGMMISEAVYDNDVSKAECKAGEKSANPVPAMTKRPPMAFISRSGHRVIIKIPIFIRC